MRYLLLMVTDLLAEGTELFVTGENPEEVAKAFGKTLHEGSIRFTRCSFPQKASGTAFIKAPIINLKEYRALDIDLPSAPPQLSPMEVFMRL